MWRPASGANLQTSPCQSAGIFPVWPEIIFWSKTRKRSNLNQILFSARDTLAVPGLADQGKIGPNRRWLFFKFTLKIIFSLFFLQKLHFSCSYKIVKERHVDKTICWNSFFVKAIWKIIGFAFFGSKCFSWVAKSKISVKLLQLARIFCVSFLQFFAWEREGEVNLFCFFGSNCSSQVALHLLFTLGKLS